MNYFDLSVICVVGLSALLSFYRGLVREVLSLGGWLVASFVTLKYLDMVTKLIKPQIGSEPLAVAVASIGLFLLTLIAFSILTRLVLKIAKPGDKVGLIDNLGGLCFGFARGALIVAIGFLIFTKLFVGENHYPDSVKKAFTRPYVEQATAWVAKLTPHYLEKAIPEAEKDAKDGLKKASEKLNEATDDAKDKLDEKSSTLPSLKDLQDRMEKENAK